MASPNFLYLTNRILSAFNEVQLTSSSFPSSVGFHKECQDAINMALFDVYTYEDTEWPFLWSNTTLPAVIGQTDYTRTDGFTALNWDSFKIKRDVYTVSSITRSSTTATLTTGAAHNAITGDVVVISGATQSGYNGTFTITVTTPTAFTFTVDSTTVTPATGTITARSQTVLQSKLQIMGWDQYIGMKYWDTDQNTNSDGYGLPHHIVRKPDNNIYLGNLPPDRVYTLYYEGFTIPIALVLYNDTCLVPEAFEQVVVDKALHYAYMFRDNAVEAQLAQDRYEKNIFKMRRILVPQETYAQATD